MKIKFILNIIIIMVLCLSMYSCGKNENNFPQNSSSEVSVQTEDKPGENSVFAQKLISKLKEKYATQINFYYVKDTTAAFMSYKPLADFKRYGKLSPFAQISGENSVEEFKNSLMLENWQGGLFNLRTLPVMVVYFGSDIHINLEEKYDGHSWISINCSEGRDVFLVPNEVYNNILNMYSEK